MDKTGQAFLVKDSFHYYRDVLTVAVEAGQPFVIVDPAGSVIVRDRGVIRHTYLFDTRRDGGPGGEFLQGTSTVHGPHPGFDEDFSFCDIAAELTGATG